MRIEQADDLECAALNQPARGPYSGSAFLGFVMAPVMSLGALLGVFSAGAPVSVAAFTAGGVLVSQIVVVAAYWVFSERGQRAAMDAEAHDPGLRWGAVLWARPADLRALGGAALESIELSTRLRRRWTYIVLGVADNAHVSVHKGPKGLGRSFGLADLESVRVSLHRDGTAKLVQLVGTEIRLTYRILGRARVVPVETD